MSSAQEQIVHTIIEGFKEQRIDALDWLRHKILGALINEANAAEAELKRAYAAIEIAREYLDKKLDYNSAPFGDYVPNDAMRCLQEINEAMEKR